MNNFALTNLDIVEGMERSAAALASTGTSIEDAFAIFTGVQEVLQNAEVAGRAIRSISLRIRGFSEDSEDGLEEVDESLADITGELASLTKTANNKQGISVFKEGSTTEFKSLVDYFGEINAIWDDMTQKQQNAFLAKAFGRNQAQAGAALITNYDSVREALEAMENSAGSADREMAVVEQSIAYKLNELKQTWVGIAQELIDRGDISNLIKTLTTLSEVIGNITTTISLPATIGLVVGAIMLLHNHLSVLKVATIDGIQQLTAFGVVLDGVNVSSRAAAIGLNLLGAALTVGITVALSLLINRIATASSKAKELGQHAKQLTSDFNQTMNTLDKSGKRIKEVGERFEELSKHVDSLGYNLSLTDDEFKEYNSLKTEIINMFPDLLKGYNNENQAILTIKGSVEELREAYDNARQAAYATLVGSNDFFESGETNPFVFKYGTVSPFGYSATDSDYYKFLSNLLKTDNFDDAKDLYDKFKSNYDKYGNGILDKSGLTNKFENPSEDFSDTLTYINGLFLNEQQKMDVFTSTVRQHADAWLHLNNQFASSTNELFKNIAIKLTNSINPIDDYSNFYSESSINQWVNNLLSTLENIPEEDLQSIYDLLIGNISDIPVNQINEMVKNYIDVIAKAMKVNNPNLLYSLLGLDQYSDVTSKLENSFDKIINIPNATMREFSKKQFREFTKDFTYEQSQIWLSATHGAKSYEEAVELYLDALNKHVEESKPALIDLLLDSDGKAKFDDYMSKMSNIKSKISEIRNTAQLTGEQIMGYLQEIATLGGGMFDFEPFTDEFGNVDLVAAYISLAQKFTNTASKSLGEYGYLAENVYNETVDEIYAVNSLADAFDNATKKMAIMMVSVNSIMSGNREMTEDDLSSIAALGTLYEDLVSRYKLGNMTTKEFFDELNVLYNHDINNYANYVIEKQSNDTGFWNGVLNDAQNAVNEFSEKYGVDLKNYATYTAAKEAIRDKFSRLEKVNDTLGAEYASNEEALVALEKRSDAIRGSISIAEEEGDIKKRDQLKKDLLQINVLIRLIESSQEKANNAINDMTFVVDHVIEKFKKATQASDEFLKSLQKEKEALDDVLSAINWFYDSKIKEIDKSIDAIERENKALNKQKDKYDQLLTAFKSVYEEKIEAIEKTVEALEKENKANNKLLENYDNMLDGVSKFYSDEEKKLEDQKDAIQDKIDALTKEREEREKILAVQKAESELERLREQRTVKVLKDGQFVYEADETAIKESQDVLDQAKFDLTIYNLQKEQELLDDQIKALQKLAEAWAEIANVKQDADNLEMVKKLLGSDWESILLTGDKDALEEFKNKYVELKTEIKNNEDEIEALEDQRDAWQKQVDELDKITSAWERAIARKIAAETYGKDWMEKLLNGELVDLDSFKTNFLNIQQQIYDNDKKVKSLEEQKLIYKDLKDQWEELSKKYEETKNRAILASFFGSNYESQLLNSSSSKWSEFATKYESIQARIEEASKKIRESLDFGSEPPEEKPKPLPTGGASRPMDNNRTDLQAYAKGTKNASQGIAEIAENGSEIIVDNYGNALLAKGHQLHKFEGGEVVIDASKTSKLLDNMGNITPLPFWEQPHWQKFSSMIESNVLPQIKNTLISKLPKVSSMYNGSSSSVINIQPGAIVLNGVQDVNTLGDAIVSKLPNYVLQQLNKR